MTSATQQSTPRSSQSRPGAQELGSEITRCPYLGLPSDPAPSLVGPAEEHYCHVPGVGQRIGLDHQAAFCLTSGYETCPRFVTPGRKIVPSSSFPSRLLRFMRGVPLLSLMIWVAGRFSSYGSRDHHAVSLTNGTRPAAPDRDPASGADSHSGSPHRPASSTDADPTPR
jgi:hypothetical protein